MKKWWQSKTVWVNFIICLLASIEASTGMLQPYLPPNWFVIVSIALPAVNVTLRFITKESIK